MFVSILDPEDNTCKERQRPAFYKDLNLDQVIDRICTLWGENVSSFYYYLPAGAAGSDYRRGIMADLKLEGVYHVLCGFMDKMKQRRESFAGKENVSDMLQKAVWHIREADDYCRAFGELFEALKSVPFCSEGMREFMSFLQQYLAGEEFRMMEEEAAALLREMDTFRLVLTYENDRISVAEGETSGEYDAFLEQCFPGHGRRMESPFGTEPELARLERELLKLFRKKSPDFFRRAEAFYGRYKIYAEDTLLRFASEIRFYLSFYCFEKKMEGAGFRFCVPQMIQNKAGRMYARGLYDLALACANTGRPEGIVSNDMEYGEGERFFVLTGPNQGGKTTFARSLGQLVCLAALGLDVPAEAAGIYGFEAVLTHFSVEESAETGRGKLMDELVRLVPVMEGSCEKTFVVINELFTTAANYDACIMGKRVLEHLINRGCMGIYVTHLAELGRTNPGTVSMRAMLDIRGERSFRIERAEAVDCADADSQVRRYGLAYGQLRERLLNGSGYECKSSLF